MNTKSIVFLLTLFLLPLTTKDLLAQEKDTLSQKQVLLSKLHQALNDQSRDIYVLDKNYNKLGPIAFFRNSNFIPRLSSRLIPLDSVAGLTETPQTYGGRGALIGGVLIASISTYFILKETISLSNKQYSKGAVVIGFGIIWGGTGALLGALIGSRFNHESINFPIYKIY